MRLDAPASYVGQTFTFHAKVSLDNLVPFYSNIFTYQVYESSNFSTNVSESTVFTLYDKLYFLYFFSIENLKSIPKLIFGLLYETLVLIFLIWNENEN